jgi:hypothetical protein
LKRSVVDAKVVAWLKSEEWKVQKVNDPNYYSFYDVIKSETNKFNLSIENDIERVTLFIRVKFEDDDRKMYLLSPDKLRYWTELKVNLMLMGIGTTIEPENDVERLESIQLLSVIYFDGLNQDRFMDKVNKINEALGLCNIMWRKFIDKSKMMNK